MWASINLKNLLVAGLVGELAFEAYAWLLSPPLFGVALAPANLIVALAKIFLGLDLSYWAGFAVHFSVGAVVFPSVVVLAHLVTRTSLVMSGAIAGFVLWFVAQGMLAPLVGRSFMMGFGAYTQSSFVGHVGMSLLMGWVLHRLIARTSQPAVTKAG